MKFISKLAGLARPRTDVFNYIFEARRPYPADRVLYLEYETGASLTLDQLERRSRQCTFTLIDKFSIAPGDVVAILATDSIFFPITYLGILAAGATVQLVPVQKELAAEDVAARLEAAGTKVLLTNRAMNGMATAAAGMVGNIPVFDFSETPEIFDGPEYQEFRINDALESESTHAFLNRTSGSTGGKMKTVITTHAHFIAAMEATLHTVPTNTDPDADVWLSTLSLGFFINAKLNMGLNILLGIPIILMSSPFGPETFHLVEKYRITFLFLPPPVAIAIAAASLPRTDVSSVKWLLSAGATMNEGVQRAVSHKLNAHLAMEWGTAETLLIALQMEGHASPPGSCGKLVNGIEAMVIDTATGKPVGPGIEGELLVRNSAAKFAGYKANQAANQSTFDENGWFHSGDYGTIDENNNVFIKDRIKELIRVGGGYGVHISATELEAVLFEHPAVSEVIVTGVPNPATHQEQATAFVVLSLEWKSRQAEALRSLKQLAAEKLVGLKTLIGGFVFVPQFPLIGFKIDRRSLKALALAQRSQQSVIVAVDMAAENNPGTGSLGANKSVPTV